MPRNKSFSRSSGSRRRKSQETSKTPSLASQLANTVLNAKTYPGQRHVTLKLPGAPVLLTTTVTSGVISNRLILDPTSQVTGWATRFGSTFDEYVVKAVRVRIRPINTASGVTRFWFDDDSTAPSANSASERIGQTLSNSQNNARSIVVMRYRTEDFVDLKYTNVANSPGSDYAFNVYTDAASWGSPVTVTPLWLIEPEFTVEFRGLAST